MHRIYLENRCMIICSPQEQALSDPNSVELHLGENPDITSLVTMFETSDTLARIYIPTEDIEETYRQFCSRFKEVNAAGGLVSNRREDVLLIRRNGLWDLPKGHQEAGEDIKVTALREVREETGVAPQAHMVVRHALHRSRESHPTAGRGHHKGSVGRQIRAFPLPEKHLSVHRGGVQGGENIEHSRIVKLFSG